jgi:hypothetical protein
VLALVHKHVGVGAAKVIEECEALNQLFGGGDTSGYVGAWKAVQRQQQDKQESAAAAAG